MKFINGEDRILYIKINGAYLPIGCLTDNSFDESIEFLDTTTRDNKGWLTDTPTSQSYSISFSGIQVNSTMVGGTFTVASYDKLKELKRGKTLLDWKIQGTEYPIVDYGQAYINQLSEVNTVGEFMTFTAGLKGYHEPLMASSQLVLLNNGDPTKIINDGTNNNLIKV
jgi:hypothetical protein